MLVVIVLPHLLVRPSRTVGVALLQNGVYELECNCLCVLNACLSVCNRERHRLPRNEACMSEWGNNRGREIGWSRLTNSNIVSREGANVYSCIFTNTYLLVVVLDLPLLVSSFCLLAVSYLFLSSLLFLLYATYLCLLSSFPYFALAIGGSSRRWW